MPGLFYSVVLILIHCSGGVQPLSDYEYQGEDFMVVFFAEFNQPSNPDKFNFLYIHSEKEGTCVLDYKVSRYSRARIKQHEILHPGRTIRAALPEVIQESLHSQITQKGVHVHCTVPVILYTLSRKQGTSNVYHGIPYKSLGTDYLIPGALNNALLAAAGVDANTVINVHIKTKCTYMYRNTTVKDGRKFTITLDKGDVFQLSREYVDYFGDQQCDLAGSYLTGSKPFAVFAGASCLFLANSTTGNGCDEGVIQVPPPTLWGKDFLVSDMAGQTNGYRLRIVASEDNTTTRIHEYDYGSFATSRDVHFALNKGDVHTEMYKRNTYLVIENTKPVFIMQYLTSDPMTVIVTPIDRFPTIDANTSHYIFATMEANKSGSEEMYVSLIVGTNNTDGVRLDGKPVAVSWAHVPLLGFSVGHLNVSYGSHLLNSVSPHTPGAVQVYGMSTRQGEAWGYSAISTCSVNCEDLSTDVGHLFGDSALGYYVNQIFNVVGSDASASQCLGTCDSLMNSALTKSICPKICPSFTFYIRKYIYKSP
ncbi:IgGFc-binding protein-like [Haliotis asinina]|uniref:IgGFc-binding protein-like n=1 Tax=Haliotis asinina TaxID=109174 RepID=UPI003532257F